MIRGCSRRRAECALFEGGTYKTTDSWFTASITFDIPAVMLGFGMHFHRLLDTPLRIFDIAPELVQKIQASDREASQVLTWRPLDMALPGMLDRAYPPGRLAWSRS